MQPTLLAALGRVIFAPVACVAKISDLRRQGIELVHCPQPPLMVNDLLWRYLRFIASHLGHATHAGEVAQ